MLVQKRRNRHAALNLPLGLLKNQGVHPGTITRGKLTSDPTLLRDLGLTDRHRPLRRERKQPGSQLPASHPAKKAKAAAVQVARVSPKDPLQP